MLNTILSLVNRVAFLAAFALVVVGAIGWCMRLFGYRLSFHDYYPGRLFEMAAVLLVLVIVLLLRDIRDNVRKG